MPLPQYISKIWNFLYPEYYLDHSPNIITSLARHYTGLALTFGFVANTGKPAGSVHSRVLSKFKKYISLSIFYRIFQKALVEFCSQMCTFNHHYEPTWLFAVPWIHFLGQESSVFTRLPASAKHNINPWWGVQSIGKAVQSYKSYMSTLDRMYVILLYLLKLFNTYASFQNFSFVVYYQSMNI